MPEHGQGHGHHGHGGQMTPEQQMQMMQQEIRLAKNLSQIKHKIVVMSGKGGVGKSTVAANIAETLQAMGYKTGILDADIHGPNVPKMLGIEMLEEQFNQYQFDKFKQLVEEGLDTSLPEDEQREYIDGLDRPIIWRGPQKTGAIKQLISDAHWGKLDFLVIDNPPGTGDEPLTVLQSIPEADLVLMVTTPNVVSQEDVLKCVKMVEMMNIKNIGLIENMAYYICPHCDEKLHIFGEGNGKTFADEMEITYLGDLPIKESVAESPTKDATISVLDPDDEVSKRFVEIVEDIKKEFLE